MESTMDIIKVDLFCLFAVYISLTDIETALQISSLSASIIYSFYKIYKERKKK